MPRSPQQQRAKATVNAIIEAGFISLSRHGSAGTTTSTIAEIAGVGVGSLYEYFANKEAVLAAMHEQFIADAVAVMRPLIPVIVHLDIRTAVITLLSTLERFLSEHNEHYLYYARTTLSVELRVELAPVTKVLSDLILQYVMHHPELMQLRHIPAMSYILINGGTFAVLRHLADPSPSITFTELSEGVASMVSHYVAQEIQTAHTGSVG